MPALECAGGAVSKPTDRKVGEAMDGNETDGPRVAKRGDFRVSPPDDTVPAPDLEERIAL